MYDFSDVVVGGDLDGETLNSFQEQINFLQCCVCNVADSFIGACFIIQLQLDTIIKCRSF